MDTMLSPKARVELLRLKLRVVDLELELYEKQLETLKDGWYHERARPTRNEPLLADIKTVYHRVWEEGFKGLVAEREDVLRQMEELAVELSVAESAES